MKNYKQGFAAVFGVIIILILLGGGTYLYSKKPVTGPVACTMEAKLCPDGSSVGRTGPNCEFAACPTPDNSFTTKPAPVVDETANWKTYRNEKYGFEVKLDPRWQIVYQENHFLSKTGSGTETVKENEANSVSIIGPGCNCLLTIEQSSKISLENWIKQIKSPADMAPPVSEKRTIISGQPAYDSVAILPGLARRSIIFVKDNSSGSLKFSLSIDFSDEKVEPSPEFDLMLSTFRFTK